MFIGRTLPQHFIAGRKQGTKYFEQTNPLTKGMNMQIDTRPVVRAEVTFSEGHSCTVHQPVNGHETPSEVATQLLNFYRYRGDTVHSVDVEDHGQDGQSDVVTSLWRPGDKMGVV